MRPTLRSAGIAGIITGLALAGEFIFFFLSGFTPDKVADPAAALVFLRDNELFLRAAVLFGAIGVAFRMVYVAGLSAKLSDKTPTYATGTLYFGVIGGVGHGLVALSYYIGFPLFIALAASNQPAAVGSWGAFSAITSGFQGFGNFLLGLMLLVAGWAMVSKRDLPAGAGAIGILAGLATLIGVFTTGTPVSSLGFAVFLPTFVLAIAFDLWVGVALLASENRRSVGLPAEPELRRVA